MATQTLQSLFHLTALGTSVAIAVHHAAHQGTDTVSRDSELAAYTSQTGLFLLWAYAVQAAYFFVAFAADFMVHTGVKPAAVTYLRDIVFATMAFPAAAIYLTCYMSKNIDVDLASDATIAGRLHECRTWFLAVGTLLEWVCVFHEMQSTGQAVVHIAAVTTVFAGMLQHANIAFDPAVVAAFAACHLAAWLVCRWITDELWEGIVTWEETASAAAAPSTAASAYVSPAKASAFLSDTEEEDAEITFKKTPAKKTPSTKRANATSSAKKTPSKSPSRAKSPARAKSKSPARAKSKSPARSAKKATPAAKRVSAKNKTRLDTEGESIAVASEQSSLPKELRFDNPGPRSPGRGRPATRLRSRRPVTYN